MVYTTDVFLLVVLLILVVIIYRTVTREKYAATNSASMVMGIGIFASFALRKLPAHSLLIGKLIMVGLFVVWLVIMWSHVRSILDGKFYRFHYKPILNRFALGTWVAGTAVLADLSVRVFPNIVWLGRSLALVALALYVPYIIVALLGYVGLWRHPLKQQSVGVILLAAVATQATYIALRMAFTSNTAVQLIEPALSVLGVVLICSGLVLIALRYRDVKVHDLALQWDDTNCIIHGAVSITGLALVLAGKYSTTVLLCVWYIAFILFIAVEVVEAIRAIQRVTRYGIRKGIALYNTAQWARDFTYGMFYAFSLELSLGLAGHMNSHPQLQFVVRYGQYVVLAIVLIEVVLFINSKKGKVLQKI